MWPWNVWGGLISQPSTLSALSVEEWGQYWWQQALLNPARQSLPFCFPTPQKGLQAFTWNLSLNLFSIDGSHREKFLAGESQIKSNQFCVQQAHKLAIFWKSELNHMLWIEKWEYILKGLIILKTPCVCTLHVCVCTCVAYMCAWVCMCTVCTCPCIGVFSQLPVSQMTLYRKSVMGDSCHRVLHSPLQRSFLKEIGETDSL